MTQNIKTNDAETKRAPLKIAAFGPHADDIELGCGASLARFIDQKKAHLYYYIFITRRRNLKGDTIPPTDRLIHSKQAFKYLVTGKKKLSDREIISNEFVVNERGRYSKFRFFNEINDELYLHKKTIFAELRRIQSSELLDVDLVFLPSLNEYHHDHKTLCELGRQVFRKQVHVLYYRTPRTEGYPFDRFNPSIIIDSSQEVEENGLYSKMETSETVIRNRVSYLDVKLKLLSLYDTEKNSDWFDKELFISIMKGYANDAMLTTNQGKGGYAEAFEGIIKV